MLIQLENNQAIDHRIENIHFGSLVHEAKHTCIEAFVTSCTI